MSTFYEQRPEPLFIGEMTHYPFSIHVHSNVELLVLTRGTAAMTVGEKDYLLTPGDALVIFPLVPHSYNRLSGDIGGVVAIFPPDIIPEYAGTFHGLLPEEPMIPASQTCPDLALAVKQINRMNMDDNLPLCIAYLHVLLASTLHSLTYRPVYDYIDYGLGRRVIQYISDHVLEDITLKSVSRALGVSVSHLSHLFSDRLHINFRHFINAIRIEKACLLMRDPNLTLTEICSLCGYTSMRTFRRAFQSERGCLPSDYSIHLKNQVYSGL